MATDDEVRDVRQNVDEPNAETYDDDYIRNLVDAVGVDRASAIIWRKKASEAAKYVDVSEAGASHAFSAIQEKFNKQAEVFEGGSTGRVRVRTIERPGPS